MNSSEIVDDIRLVEVSSIENTFDKAAVEICYHLIPASTELAGSRWRQAYNDELFDTPNLASFEKAGVIL